VTALIWSLAQRMHREFVAREARRAQDDLDRLAGFEVIDLPDERRADGTRCEWSALLHRGPAPRRIS